jgi:hypothetical protein
LLYRSKGSHLPACLHHRCCCSVPYLFVASFQLVGITMGRFLRKLRKKIEEKFPDPSTARDAFEEKKREYYS